MKLFRNLRMPSPGMVIAVIALVFALGGTAIAAKQLTLSALTDGAKNKTVGVGKLTYADTTTTLSAPNPAEAHKVSATCPRGLRAIGGGVRAQDPANTGILDDYPTTTGWSARVTVLGTNRAVTVIAICAKSRVVTGAPPTS